MIAIGEQKSYLQQNRNAYLARYLERIAEEQKFR